MNIISTYIMLFLEDMMDFASFMNKLQRLQSFSRLMLAYFCRSACFLIVRFYSYVVLCMNLVSTKLLYFLSVSFLGFVVLKALKPRTDSFRPRNLDLLFTSVSATTVSSMSTVEMEVFSNTQLLVLTTLMFIGGKVFTSMFALHLRRFKLRRFCKTENKAGSTRDKLSPPCPTNVLDQIELGMETKIDSEKPELEVEFRNQVKPLDSNLKSASIKFLSYIISGYFLVIHVVGMVLLFGYVTLVPSSRDVLKNKGLSFFTFSIFTVVSTFANCGFIPTNENMILFRKNSGLLLIIIPQVLLGNTLFPSCLRFLIWFLGKFVKKDESNYLLKNVREIEYPHLLPDLHSSLLVLTVLGFILIQFILFCSMEWNSAALSGLNSVQKVVAVLFQTVNSRHAGENVVDLSTLSPAILVLFVVMMYLPPYTSFLPIKDDELCQQECERKKKRRPKVMEDILFSHLSYLAIFVILICIAEKERTKEDPLNFSLLNIVVEVISAYGNVGYTTGYSCTRQLKPDGNCKTKWYGFSGKWSDEGKLILIVVMIFGRIKKCNMDGGRAWKLL